MTTHPKRWLSHIGAFGVVIACALLLLAGMSGQASAQPSAAVIMDARTGEIIQSSNPNARVHPASLTKMMTLYIAFEAMENGEISADSRVRISATAARQPPSRLGLRAGQRIAFRYLVRAAALRSANDAATAIAEALEGSVSNFADRMNRTARAIGMRRTTFRNPHGLTANGHLSTARDMSILGRQLYFDYPEYYRIFSRLSDSAGIATVRNTNRRFLNGYRGADGIKTGYTSAAGYNLTAMAERNGVRILVTVMGARSSTHRYHRIVELMDRGFRLAPRRAAVRRPRRPNYVRAPDDRGSGVAAGRTIRLQTAPARSRFPRPRPPVPGQAPSEELVASLRSEIDAVIEDIRPEDANETARVEEQETETPVQLASVAPERSPRPAPRPESAVSDAAAVVARAAGFTVIDPEQYAAITQGPSVLPEDVAPQDQTPQAQTPEAQTTLAEDMPVPDEVPVAEEGENAVDSRAVALAELAPEQTGVSVQFNHTDQELEAVQQSDGQLEIPGLPPIELGAEPQPVEVAEVAPLSSLPEIEPRAEDLRVDGEGRVLWRDEEVLTALSDEDPGDPVLAPAIVLTSSASEDPPPPTPMPEIVARVSTSGGQVWSVNLGSFASRFDADRHLLRMALSESGTLGRGLRRTNARNGAVQAEIHSLTRADAEAACRRLTARGADCTVIAPAS